MEGLKLEAFHSKHVSKETSVSLQIIFMVSCDEKHKEKEGEGSFPPISGLFLYLSPTQILHIHLLTAMAHVYESLSHNWLIPFPVDPFTVKMP